MEPGGDGCVEARWMAAAESCRSFLRLCPVALDKPAYRPPIRLGRLGICDRRGCRQARSGRETVRHLVCRLVVWVSANPALGERSNYPKAGSRVAAAVSERRSVDDRLPVLRSGRFGRGAAGMLLVQGTIRCASSD